MAALQTQGSFVFLTEYWECLLYKKTDEQTHARAGGSMPTPPQSHICFMDTCGMHAYMQQPNDPTRNGPKDSHKRASFLRRPARLPV